VCKKVLVHQGSLRRHLATVHGIDEAGNRLTTDQIARLRGTKTARPPKGKRPPKAARTKQPKSVEFIAAFDSDVKPSTPPPVVTVVEPPGRRRDVAPGKSSGHLG